MARYFGTAADEARARLSDVGVWVHEIGEEGSDREKELVAATLPEGKRHIRDTFFAAPPAPGLEYAAHCAWHRNQVHEAHTIAGGEGIFQFWTSGGPITVHVATGDLVIIQGAEHRYLPLNDQPVRLRHSGNIDDFGYVATDRVAENWPSVDVDKPNG